MEENDNDPNRRELNYSKAYRKKYEEKFGGKKLSGNQKVNGKDKVSLNQKVNGGDKVSLNQKVNGLGDYFKSSSTSFKSKQ